MPSISTPMSRAVGRRSVPLKNMCSAKCAMPFVSARFVARAGGEEDEARGRATCGIDAVSRRSPLSRVVRSKAGIRLRVAPSIHRESPPSGPRRSRRRRARSSPRRRRARPRAARTPGRSSWFRRGSGLTAIAIVSPNSTGERKSISSRARIMFSTCAPCCEQETRAAPARGTSRTPRCSCAPSSRDRGSGRSPRARTSRA